MTAWYNEIDKLKAEVLREAIKAGAIAPGVVDERSIADIDPDELMGYTQCHFFAGGGFWSVALRLAGWPDDRPVWTGSCPCPSFSAAGKGGGFDDPRHLWPAWAKLIRQRKPAVIFGEQADDAVGYGWLDLIQTDLEAEAYAVGKVVFGACSVGAPHIRQRLYFVAESEGAGRQLKSVQRPATGIGGALREAESLTGFGSCSTAPIGMANPDGGITGNGELQPSREHGQQPKDGGTGVLANAASTGRRQQREDIAGSGERSETEELEQRPRSGGILSGPGPLNGFWRDADWIGCRDGKFRPVRPGSFPLAHGSPARLGRLHMYGDAIVVQAAQAFIEAYLEGGG